MTLDGNGRVTITIKPITIAALTLFLSAVSAAISAWVTYSASRSEMASTVAAVAELKAKDELLWTAYNAMNIELAVIKSVMGRIGQDTAEIKLMLAPKR